MSPLECGLGQTNKSDTSLHISSLDLAEKKEGGMRVPGWWWGNERWIGTT